jgi:hypothetical protein
MLSFLEYPKGKKVSRFFWSRYFWQCHDTKKNYWLTKWNIIYFPKNQCGLGVEVLEFAPNINDCSSFRGSG